MPTKQELDNLKKILENANLLDEMEKMNPGIKAQLTGMLIRPWIPVTWSKRMIMLALLAAAALGSVFLTLWFLLALIPLPFFSPKVFYETLFLLARLKR
jgi:hypothetical protein